MKAGPPPKAMRTLANNLHFILEQLDRKPAWLAKASKVDPPTIGRVLAAQGNVTLKTLEAIATALEVDPDQLISEGRGGILSKQIEAKIRELDREMAGAQILLTEIRLGKVVGKSEEADLVNRIQILKSETRRLSVALFERRFRVPRWTSVADFLEKFESLEVDLQKIVVGVVYQDMTRVGELSSEFRAKFSQLISMLGKPSQSRP